MIQLGGVLLLLTGKFGRNIIALMIKKFLIFLFVFCFLLRISPEVLALDINIREPITTPIILPTETPTPTPASIIKPRGVTTIVFPSPTPSPTVAPEGEIEEEILTSPTPQPTPTPEVSLPPTSLPSTNVWQINNYRFGSGHCWWIDCCSCFEKGREKQAGRKVGLKFSFKIWTKFLFNKQ